MSFDHDLRCCCCQIKYTFNTAVRARRLMHPQSVMNWRRALGFDEIFLYLDADHHHLCLRSPDKTKVRKSMRPSDTPTHAAQFFGVLDIDAMTDVRIKPFTDESEV